VCRIALSLIAFFSVIVVVVCAGEDPWKRPFAGWTENDVAVVQQISPWAKTTQSKGAYRPDGVTPASGSGGIPGTASDTSNTSLGATPGQPGGLEKNAAAGPVKYSVWWASSRTIRAASLRDSVLKGKMTQKDAEKILAQPVNEYEILVRGTNMHVFQQRGEKAFENAAWVQLKKPKQKLIPTHVLFRKGLDGASVIAAVFFFPKKGAGGEPTIGPDENEIDFYLLIADQKLITYFEPKRMVDNQGEDL
jgi:hypothetical protein